MTAQPQRPPPLLEAASPLPTEVPFTLAQARDLGISRHRIRRLEAGGLVRRLLKGVYVAAQVPDSIGVRLQAVALLAPSHVVLTDWTACWLYTGLLPPNEHLDVPRLCLFRPAGHDRLRNSLCASGERSFRAEDLVVLRGLTVTTPLRTAWDLGRLAHRDQAIAALDALLRHGSFSAAELVDGTEHFARRRGVVQLRSLAPLADARAESPGESILRLRWLDLAHLPAPEPQVSVRVGGIEVYRVDLGVPELRYGCEYDGEAFHGANEQEKDAARRADLRSRFGWDVDAVRRGNVFGPTRDVEEVLTRGIRRARAALARPTYLA